MAGKDSGVGGAHRHDPPLSIEEATRRELEFNRQARETDPRMKAQHEKLQADAAKVYEKAKRRRARNPYDFG